MKPKLSKSERNSLEILKTQKRPTTFCQKHLQFLFINLKFFTFFVIQAQLIFSEFKRESIY